MNIETEYQNRISAMTPREKMERSVAMAVWTRQALARLIRAEVGTDISDERLKWLVARHIYGAVSIAQKKPTTR